MPGISQKPITIIASGEMREMAQAIARKLADKEGTRNMVRYVDVNFRRFANGEFEAKVEETIRHTDVYFLHSMQHPDPNTSLVQLLLANDALKRASAKSITLVIPYISYMREDRKAEERVPISAKLVFDLIGANRAVKHILTFDLHSEQEQGFFDGALDDLTALKIHAQYVLDACKDSLDSLAVLSPDFGRSKYVKRFSKYLEKLTGKIVPVVVCDKDRTGANQSGFAGIIGGEQVAGRTVLLSDDIVDTAGSVLPLVDIVDRLGAKKLIMLFTHGVLSPKDGITAEERLRATGAHVVITNTIPRPKEYQKANEDFLTILPIENLLTESIYESWIPGGSISKMKRH